VNRTAYLSDTDVCDFLAWLDPRLDVPGQFQHAYTSPRSGPWQCTSVYDAYERYTWPFKTALPPADTEVVGKTFEESYLVLSSLQTYLRSAVQRDDVSAFHAGALSVLRWGGVLPRNRTTLVDLRERTIDVFSAACQQLRPATADLDELADVGLMNAGFTKVYALLIDDFPIYDGRVGAALGYLVRLYAVEAGKVSIPPTLRFAWGAAKGAPGGARKNRNPSTGTLRFPKLRADVRQHARCNLMAAWLLGEISQRGAFGRLSAPERMRAVEAALFMIGYEVPG